MEIKLNLEFFVQVDKKNNSFQAKNSQIKVKHFEDIDKVYPLKTVKGEKTMEHIQENCLNAEDISYILAPVRHEHPYDIEENIKNGRPAEL